MSCCLQNSSSDFPLLYKAPRNQVFNKSWKAFAKRRRSSYKDIRFEREGRKDVQTSVSLRYFSWIFCVHNQNGSQRIQRVYWGTPTFPPRHEPTCFSGHKAGCVNRCQLVGQTQTTCTSPTYAFRGHHPNYDPSELNRLRFGYGIVTHGDVTNILIRQHELSAQEIFTL